MMNNDFIVSPEHPIKLNLFGKWVLFTDIEEACVEASWCLNREVYPFEIKDLVENGKELIRYRY